MDRGTSLDDGVRDEGEENVRGKCSSVSGVNVQTGGIGMTLSLLDEREEDVYIFFFFNKLFCIRLLRRHRVFGAMFLWNVCCHVYIGITPWGNAS